MIAKVALYYGDQRTETLRAALEAVIDQIPWNTRQDVVVKPNLVMESRPYAITHREALAVTLEMIRDRYSGKLTIAEGCAVSSTREAFANQRYNELAQRFDCRLVDLNTDEPVPVIVHDKQLADLHLRLSRTIVESDCRVSLCLPKTHDAVLVTLSLKNMIMGSLVNRRLSERPERPFWLDRVDQIMHGHGNGRGSDKLAMHQSFPVMNLNLALLAPLVTPHLSVVDGFIAMEGEGPVNGDPIPWGVAFAGTDALAVDATVAGLMGFPIEQVGYLHYCARLGLGAYRPEEIDLIGNVDPASIARNFRPHPRHEEQRKWQFPDVEERLFQNARA
ncbi:MAG TPA: DUF362 domain-containing protein [Anaerolineales bacterium]|nr:DUF362 domain-containing protein [Anaerolineales bacterium]